VAGAKLADSRLARNTLQASAMLTRLFTGAGLVSGISGAGGLPVQKPAFSKASAIPRASAQSGVPVVFLENLPASVPETWIGQLHLRPSLSVVLRLP